MKRYPYFLLIFLFIILTFILGFRSGQKTEQTNEAINFVLSITPTPPPATPTPVKYLDYESEKWNLKFTYPSNLTVKESTNTPEIRFELNNE